MQFANNKVQLPPVSLLDDVEYKKIDKIDIDTIHKLLEENKLKKNVLKIEHISNETHIEISSVGVYLKDVLKFKHDLETTIGFDTVILNTARVISEEKFVVEVNEDRSVYLRLKEFFQNEDFSNKPSPLTIPIGKDDENRLVYVNLSNLHHLLIGGTTGSGKSVFLNSIILSILLRNSPEEVKLILIDPKKVEFNAYNGIPHLLVPVVTDPKKAVGSLGWALVEMNKRYQTFADNKVKDILSFNEKAKKNEELEKMPYIVVIIDEFTDLMMTAGADAEVSICQLARLGRAAGIHLIIATQRPSTDFITGLIKANIPSRISFAMLTRVDSRVILDCNGAEDLNGNGDMLFMPIGISKPIRVQGCFVSDEEKEKVISFLQTELGSLYDESIIEEINYQAESCRDMDTSFKSN